jgi:hypothetical protein
MADYIYNPAESIKQSFQQTQAGIGNMFTQIIAQQQRDYSLAENTLSNVEALKKNLGLYGTKEITDGANNLLGQVTSAITKDGKLDYSKLGAVRQQISDLSDLKTGYDTFGKQFDRLVQVGAANKENLTSFESFYKKLTSLAGDKKLIANPNDLSKAMNDVLEDHINTSKMGITAIKNNLPTVNLAGKYIDPKTKTEVEYSAEVFDGVTIGADGKPIRPTDPVFYQGLAAKIKASDPSAFDAQRRKLSKIGLSETSDADIVKTWFDSMPAAAIKPASVKTDREIKKEELAIQQAEITNRFLPQKEQAMINAYNRRNTSGGEDATIQYAQENVYDETLKLPNKGSFGLTGISLGKNTKLDINGRQGLVTDILKSKESGDIWVKALVKKGADDKEQFIISEDNLEGAQTVYRKIKNPSTFTKELSQRIQTGGYSKKVVPFITAGVNTVLGAESKNLRGGQGASVPKPSAPKPAGKIPLPKPIPVDQF